MLLKTINRLLFNLIIIGNGGALLRAPESNVLE
jgi:hypothetical protein